MVSLVLLPGSDGTASLFSRFVESIDLECHLIDYPRDTLKNYEELEAIVRSRLPSAGSYVLLGESFSGPIATSIAASPPQGLVGLILCASFVNSPRPAARLLLPLLPILPARPPLILLARVLMGRFSTPELSQELGEALRSVSPSVLRGRMRCVLGVNYLARLQKVEVPALYLRATEDRVVPAHAAALFEANTKNGQVREIEAPHFLLQCRPKEAATAVSQFVSKLGAGI